MDEMVRRKSMSSGEIMEQKMPASREAKRVQLREEAKSLEGTQRQRELRRKDYYIHQPASKLDLESSAVSKHQESYKIGNVRKAICDVMGTGVYDKILEVKQGNDEEGRKVKLHHSRGTALFSEGKKVLQFNMAGSGFTLWRRENKGFFGKKGDGEGEEEQRKSVYGEKQTYKGKTDKYVRKRVMDKDGQQAKEPTEIGETKIKYTVAGPGAFNTGDYSIENTREYIRERGADYLEQLFRKWKYDPKNGTEVRLMIKGHSRGGVSAGTGAMKLKAWIHEHYPEMEHLVKFELIQYDPVPGSDAASGVNEEIGHLDSRESFEVKGEKFRPLGEDAETTVIYSLHSDHPVFFTPQLVTGAKRVILTPLRHSVGLENIDESQKEMEQGETAHGQAFTDAQTGEVYRGSGISELPEGLYMMDEKNHLILMRNEQQAKEIVERLLKDTRFQESRHRVIYQVIESWFQTKKEKETGDRAKEREKEKKFSEIVEKSRELAEEVPMAAAEMGEMPVRARERERMSSKELRKRKKEFLRKKSLSDKARALWDSKKTMEPVLPNDPKEHPMEYRRVFDGFLHMDINRFSFKTDKDICSRYKEVYPQLQQGKQLNQMVDRALADGMEISREDVIRLRATADTCQAISEYLDVKMKILSNPYYSLLIKKDIDHILEDGMDHLVPKETMEADQTASMILQHCTNASILKKFHFNLKDGPEKVFRKAMKKRSVE